MSTATAPSRTNATSACTTPLSASRARARPRGPGRSKAVRRSFEGRRPVPSPPPRPPPRPRIVSPPPSAGVFAHEPGQVRELAGFAAQFRAERRRRRVLVEDALERVAPACLSRAIASSREPPPEPPSPFSSSGFGFFFELGVRGVPRGGVPPELFLARALLHVVSPLPPSLRLRLPRAPPPPRPTPRGARGSPRTRRARAPPRARARRPLGAPLGLELGGGAGRRTPRSEPTSASSLSPRARSSRRIWWAPAKKPRDVAASARTDGSEETE